MQTKHCLNTVEEKKEAQNSGMPWEGRVTYRLENNDSNC